MVGFEGSGNSSTLRPLASRYSVMPSTLVMRVIPAGTPSPLGEGWGEGRTEGNWAAGGAGTTVGRAGGASRGWGAGGVLGGEAGTDSGGRVGLVPGATTGGDSVGCGAFF